VRRHPALLKPSIQKALEQSLSKEIDEYSDRYLDRYLKRQLWQDRLAHLKDMRLAYEQFEPRYKLELGPIEVLFQRVLYRTLFFY